MTGAAAGDGESCRIGGAKRIRSCTAASMRTPASSPFHLVAGLLAERPKCSAYRLEPTRGTGAAKHASAASA
jgi:hypothetical protein